MRPPPGETVHGGSSPRDSRTAQAGGGARPLPGETAARRDGRASMKAAAAAAFGEGLSPNSHGETATRRLRGSAARRGVDNLDREPAVPLPCAGIRFVQRSRLLRIPFEIRKESSGPLGGVSASFGGALSPDTAITGTAAAVALRTAASVPLKSLRRLFGRFGIVSREEQDRQTSLCESDWRIGFVREAIVRLFKNASRWSWHTLIGFIFDQCCHCFWES
jgi:hypothetical protein